MTSPWLLVLGLAGPPSSEASATEPAATEASATEASATEPAATESAAPEASATEPAATEASATEASATEPAAAELPELAPLPELPELEPLPDLGSLPDLDPPTSDDAPPSSSPTDAKPAIPSAREVMTGSLRLVGAFLHFDDIPELYPNGDDGLLAVVARVMVHRDFAHGLSLELNYFADLSRLPSTGGGWGGAFGTAGSTDSVYRSPFLSWSLWRDGSIRGGAGVDRFALGLRRGPVSLRAGRFPVSYSVTNVFTPNDFLAPFSVTAVNRIYKPGVDAISFGTSLGMIGSLEVVGVLGNAPDGDPTWGRSALLARASVIGGGFEWSALGGKVAERWVVGGGFQGSIGAVGLRGEAHLGVPDVDGDGHDADDEAKPIHVRVATGPSLTVGWRNLTLGAEYAFYSDGARTPDALLDRATRLFPDDVPLLARHYVGAVVGMEPIPVLRTSVLTLVDANDGSGLAGLSLSYSVADEADLIGGVFVPWGADPMLTGDPMRPLALGSGLGASPVSVYLEARTFF